MSQNYDGIYVENISRNFESGGYVIEALKDVTFHAEPGTITALLGVNGSGKTTITKILSTLLYPTSGEAWVNGINIVKDPKKCRRFTSVIFGGDRGFYQPISGRENLRYFAMQTGLSRKEVRERIDPMLEQVGLSDAADRRVETYSKGMLQRLHIAVGLISNPTVLLLDEPTVGLDPSEAKRLRESIARAKQSGVTVLLTSHQLLDVERLADRILLLDQGIIKEDLSLEEFVRLADYIAVVKVSGRGKVPEFHPEAKIVENDQDNSWEASFKVKVWTPEFMTELAEFLAHHEVDDIKVSPVYLDDVFGQVMDTSK